MTYELKWCSSLLDREFDFHAVDMIPDRLQFRNNNVISNDPRLFARENNVDEIWYDQSCPCRILIGTFWQILSRCSLTTWTLGVRLFGLDLDQRLKQNDITSNTEKRSRTFVARNSPPFIGLDIAISLSSESSSADNPPRTADSDSEIFDP
jgi:hypothetical protein